MKVTRQTKRNIMIVSAIVLGLVIIGTLIGGVVFYRANTVPTFAPPQYDQAGNPVMVASEVDEVIRNLQMQPETTVGKFVIFNGEVVTPTTSAEQGQFFSFLAEQAFGGGEMRVYLPDAEMTVKVGDYLQVTGYIAGFITPIGKPLIPIIQATAMTTAQALEVLRPAFLVYDVADQQVESGQLTLTITELEYAYEETRMLVTVVNSGPEAIKIDWLKATSQVGDRVFTAQPAISEAQTLALPEQIEPNTQVQGVLFFPSMKPYPTEVVIPIQLPAGELKLKLPIPVGLLK